MNDGATLAAVLEVRRRIDSFAASFERLPADALRPASWGPREVLAHLVFWHEHYVRVLGAELDGREPELPVGSFNALNAQAVASLRGVAIEDLVARLLRAQQTLERLAARAGAPRVRIRIKTGAGSRVLSVFLRRVAGHVRGHEAQLKRELRLRSSARLRS